MAGHGYQLGAPRVVEVELTGRLPDWVEAKDVILELLRRHGVRGGAGVVFEFTGEGVATLSVTERATICNMIVETGRDRGDLSQRRAGSRVADGTAARGRLDRAARRRRRRLRRPRAHRPAALEPLVAIPQSPGNVVPVADVAGTRVVQVCVGLVGELLLRRPGDRGRGARRRVRAPRGRSDRHARVAADPRHDRPQRRLPRARRGRGADAGAGLRAVHRHRAGTDRGAGVGAHVQPQLPRPQRHRRRPRLPVLAVDGGGHRAGRRDHRPADPRRAARRSRRRPSDPSIVDRHIAHALPPDEAAPSRSSAGRASSPHRCRSRARNASRAASRSSSATTSRPATWRPTVPSACRSGRTSRPAPGTCSAGSTPTSTTDHASGREGAVIVGGHNYGQGSSREQAALAPLHLGVPAVVAASFARIHRRNLIAQGIVPLLFDDDADRERVRVGDRWQVDGVRAAVLSGSEELAAHVEDREPIRLRLELSAAERKTLAAGGLLRQVREHAYLLDQCG